MAFDWRAFVERHNVQYVETGRNVARDHINIKCPFCVSDPDPSEHMGLSLKDSRWGCYRNKDHRGKNPARLIRRLLGCTHEEAKTIAGDDTLVRPESIEGMRGRLELLDATKEAKASSVVFPKEFRKLTDRTSPGKRVVRYIEGRGFTIYWLRGFVDRYDLHYAVSGRYAHRVILPVYERKTLRGWTARAIGRAELRYDAYPAGDQIKNYLYNHQVAYAKSKRRNKILFITEGPFDAMKVDLSLRKYPASAVALMSTSAKPAQINAIMRLGYRKCVILFDNGATRQAYQLRDSLIGCRAVVKSLPENVDDPAELSEKKIVKIYKASLDT